MLSALYQPNNWSNYTKMQDWIERNAIQSLIILLLKCQRWYIWNMKVVPAMTVAWHIVEKIGLPLSSNVRQRFPNNSQIYIVHCCTRLMHAGWHDHHVHSECRLWREQHHANCVLGNECVINMIVAINHGSVVEMDMKVTWRHPVIELIECFIVSAST